ncbi:hypothetical protein BY458DRAFT_215151 [Sporodiniella umbellata]|nr:hypothetical protein BY458DRAFT_215151 [Sporodiniella umbellata]
MSTTLNIQHSKLLTREEIIELARTEYARQLSKYTQAQLMKNKQFDIENTEKNTYPGVNQKNQDVDFHICK